jgi:hypothetical protein
VFVRRSRAAATKDAAAGRPAVPVAGGEIVAVIAAAIAATSGAELGSFEVRGIRPSAAAGSFAQRGLNTPAWGHVDRFLRGDQG